MTTYTMMDVLMASPTEPLPEAKRRHQLTRMFLAMRNLEQDPEPTVDDWECVNDAVLLMQSLWLMGVVQDPEEQILHSIDALGKSGIRSLETGRIRLDGKDIGILRGILRDYADVLEVLPARTMIKAHMETERRVAKMMRKHGRKK